jgi:fatty-acyl-CoA synthase
MQSSKRSSSDPLLPRIRRAAAGTNSVTFVGSAGGLEDSQTVSWGKLHEDALAAAAALQKRGIKPGDNVALLGLTSRELVTAMQGVWLTGACVNMLPIPMRMNSIAEFALQTRAHLSYSDARMLLLDPGLAALYEAEAGDPPIVLFNELMPGDGKPTAADYREIADDPESLAILQFTSGSTSVPKGVMLPQRVLCANIDAMDEVVELDTGEDVLVSWLPLYHDMGLIGVLTTSMIKGCNLILAAPQDFLSKPADWMRWLSDYKGTITAGPNFSYILATRALRRMSDNNETLDLSRVRMALNGAEPVDPDSVEKFVAAAQKHGFRPGAEFCAFGMAEITIAGTFPPVMRGMVCDAVDRAALENERIARPADPALATTRRLPLLGGPVPGLSMRICDHETGRVLVEREIGELQIKGTSVTSGYYKRPDLTEELIQDGWLNTGDLGYFVNGPDNGPLELVLCGRIKDVIIIAGRNIYPEDIERAAGAVEGVRAGNVIAFGIDGGKGKESVVVVAEVKAGSHKEIRKLIRYRVISICGIPPKEIALVQPGTLPKTSSGKLQRSLCKQQFLKNELKLAGEEISELLPDPEAEN